MIKTFFKRNTTRLHHLCILILAFLMMFPTVVMAFDVEMEIAENAQIIPKYIPFEGPKFLDELGSVSTKEAIVVDGKEYLMYCTFDEPEVAVENFRVELEDFIDLLQTIYALPDFSPSTAGAYYYASIQLLDDDSRPEWYNEGGAEFKKMESFYDIYENVEANNDIKRALATSKSTSANAGENTMDLDVALLLPYGEYTAYLNDKYLTIKDVQEHVGINALNFTISKGVEYASTYATSPNKWNYGYFSIQGDCTNFASQILENGGVTQDRYASENSGWWHKYTENHLGGRNHSYSVSWINANTFVRYMGVGYTTSNHTDFSRNIAIGDFIAFDADGDGSWQHVGFVTARRTIDSSLGYVDYRVAQHSSNYHEWTSSDKNHWENALDSSKGLYARVRR